MVAKAGLKNLGRVSYKFMNLKLMFLFNGNVFFPGLFCIRAVSGFHLRMLF